MSAVELYILISNRSQEEWKKVKLCMVKVILRHLKHCPDIPFRARQMYTGGVKLTTEINTLFEDTDAFLAPRGPEMWMKRKKWRFCSWRSRKRHAQIVSLYGSPHIK